LLTGVLTVFSVACTEDEVDAGPSAESFLAAWSEEDFEGMAEHFDETTAARWDPDALAELFDRIRREGAIETFEVAPEGEVDESEDDGATIGYVVTYRSSASARPVRLDGRLPLSLDEENERWTVSWDDGLMWPGVEGASGFKTTAKWPERANILDRDGRRVAVGPAGSRSYPFGSRAGNTIGHIAPATKDDLKGLPVRYRVGDLIGASGLERGLEERLAGQPTSDLFIVDDAGSRLEEVGHIRGRKADPIRLSIDMEVQAAAESAYGGTTGGSVIFEPRTGYVLAIVSSGPFDPGNYVGVPGIEPFNRAISGLYPPGSSMKVVTAAAAIDEGVVTRNTRVTGPANYQGVRNFESGTFGSIPFSTAMQNSVNTAFAQVAEDLGAKRMFQAANAFGFNKTPKLPIAVARSAFPRPEDLSDLMWGSIGQAQVVATPFQMASIAATIANDGERIEPRIVMGDPIVREQAVSTRTAATVTDLMELVVQAGTGTAANLGSSIPVAGKTGTAEVGAVGDIQNHAWFICFAPSDKPKIAVAVVSEFGGTGGSVAAPIARGILQSVLPLV
jgi:cell division protein FtsI/penicillin-binding protein 2